MKLVLVFILFLGLGLSFPKILMFFANSVDANIIWEISDDVDSNAKPIHRAEEINWQDLLPENEMKLHQEMKTRRDNAQSFGEQLLENAYAANNDNYQDALISTQIMSEWVDKRVKISGYTVPLDVEGGSMSAFFLVPYYGACIHYPPPPPNQIIYVRLEQPMEMLDLQQAYSIEGVLTAGMFEDPIGTSAYILEPIKIGVYQEPLSDWRDH